MANRKQASVYATRAAGRPMANGGGMHRARKRLRKQVKTALRVGRFEYYHQLPTSLPLIGTRASQCAQAISQVP